MTARLVALLGASVAALAACGGTPGPAFTADPRQYLLTIDQLASPDFTVDPAQAPPRAPAHAAVASVAFLRSVDFATSNGPIEVIDTVERFPSSADAHASYAADVAARDAAHGEVPASTGALGDEAHADSLVVTAPDGIPAVQVLAEWRTANIVVVLTLRGRYGGTRLDDALLLAHRQMSAQLNG